MNGKNKDWPTFYILMMVNFYVSTQFFQGIFPRDLNTSCNSVYKMASISTCCKTPQIYGSEEIIHLMPEE